MTCLSVFLIIVAILIVVASVSRQRPAPSSAVQATYQLVAQRFRGRCERAGWSRWPLLRFRYRDAGVEVHTHRAPEFQRWWVTEVRLSWPDAGACCEVVYPASAALPARLPFRDVTLGVAEFDQRHRVRAVEPGHAAQLLTPAVRWQIDRLRRLGLGGEPFRVVFESRGLRVAKARLLSRYEELMPFVELSLELYDQILLMRSQGIEFLDDRQALPVDQSVCRVCGESIESDLVFCRRCKTPHHRDCWQYAGQCSVFGCGETQYDVPHLAKPQDRGPGPAGERHLQNGS
jgi:hypothetical protein